MVDFIKESKLSIRKHATRGRPCKIALEDQLLLLYYREYRTFLHISRSYGISEMQCWRIITDTEKLLLSSNLFHLPGKKALHDTENSFEIVVVDVSEPPVERPKKTKKSILR
jgi:hypothetical protein